MGRGVSVVMVKHSASALWLANDFACEFTGPSQPSGELLRYISQVRKLDHKKFAGFS